MAVAHPVVGLHAIGQMRFFFVGNETDFVLAHPYAAVGSIQVRVTTGTGLEFQGLRCFIEGPDAGEGDVQMAYYHLGALL